MSPTSSEIEVAPSFQEPLTYKDLSKKSLIFSFSLVTSLFFLWGLSYGLLDVLNAHFLSVFNLTKTQSTLLQFAYFIAYLVVAPPAGMLMRKYGYKKGIHAGLTIFSIGAVMFWPAAIYHKYGMFVAFTFVCGSGMAVLEVAAGSYITILGPPETSAFRLTLAQAFNGIASVLGPVIAAQTFLKEDVSKGAGSVQYVYLAMSVLALILNIALAFAKLPEVTQVVVVAEGEVANIRGFLKKRHTIFGFAAEFCYCGSQVAVASLTIFYLTSAKVTPPISTSMASNLFSACQATFTVGRFIGVWYLSKVEPAFALFANGLGLILFSILTATIPGRGGIACLFLIFFCEAVCYPVIFSVATADLGSYAKLGAGLIAAGVCGGSAFPAMQAAVADVAGTHISYLMALIGFVPVCAYGGVMWYIRCQKYNGGLTIWQLKPTTEAEDLYDSPSHALESEIKQEQEFVEDAKRD